MREAASPATAAPSGAGALAPAPGGGTAEPLALIDMGLMRDYAAFGWGSLRRHRLRSLLAFGLVAGSAALSAWALPRTYHVESKVLAQPNQLMPALDNPSRAVPQDADAPTRSASETVLQRANLSSLVRQTNLLEQWSASRAPAVRLKDALLVRLLGKPTEEERLDAMIGLLEKRLKVTTPERVVDIEIDWPDGQMAYQLVDTAQQNFLETRHAMEVSAIAEAISILESHVATARSNLDQAVEGARVLRESQAQAHPAPMDATSFSAPAPRLARVSVARARLDPETNQLRSLAMAKHEAIHDLETFRRRRLSELQSQLTEALGTFGPSHPTILTLRQTIDQMQRDSPQLVTLRQEEQQLLAEFIHRGGRDPDAPGGAVAAPTPKYEGTVEMRPAHKPAPAPAARGIAPGSAATAPADVGLAEDQLRMAGIKYDDLLGRLEAARIELDTARAAFKYRYSVVTPAQVPKHAAKPNLVLTVVAGLVGGLFVSLLVSVAADLRAGKLVERWQIQRGLRLPILAEVDHL